MPWTPYRYPPAMQHLPLAVRLKAIEVANALLAEGCDEGQAIRMAIAAARKWARREGEAVGWRRAGRGPAAASLGVAP
jgi:uncharacterized protein YdaT